LDVVRAAFDYRDRGAESFDERATVGRVEAGGRSTLVCAAKEFEAEALRRLRSPEPRAFQCAKYATALRLFNCVRRRDGEDGRAALFGLAHGSVNLFGRDEGADAVVNRHYLNVVRVERAQAAPDGLGARLAPGDCARAFAQAVSFGERQELALLAFGQDDDRLGDGRALLEATERVDDDWDAGDFPELLGTPAAHPAPPPGGDDDRDVHKSPKFKVQSSKFKVGNKLLTLNLEL